jgi:hypothetical protein
MIFYNVEDLTKFLLTKNWDHREWGELEIYCDKEWWNWWEKCIHQSNTTAQEKEKAKKELINKIEEYANKNFIFPIKYTCECTESNGNSAFFKVEYTHYQEKILQDTDLSFIEAVKTVQDFCKKYKDCNNCPFLNEEKEIDICGIKEPFLWEKVD